MPFIAENVRLVPFQGAEPTPFNRERAEEIWQGRGPCDDSCGPMTPGENAYVMAIWMAITDGSSSFATAFFEILNGRVAWDGSRTVSLANPHPRTPIPPRELRK